MAALRHAPGCVDIVVADNGPGIPQDKLQLAIEPFERLSTHAKAIAAASVSASRSAKAIAEGHEGELMLAKNEPAAWWRRFGCLPGGSRNNCSSSSAM